MQPPHHSSENSKLGLVTDPKEVGRIAETLRQQKSIGVDTEFIRETTFFPKIALIQVATREETWLLDPTALNPSELAPFLSVLQDPNILKIMHAAHSDQECFYTAYGVLVSPVLDTSIAAALVGMGDNLGLGRLLKELVNVNLPKGRARARWLARPLSHELLEYASHDVAYLVEMGEVIEQKLRAKSRWEWALEESVVKASLFEVTPEEMARKLSKSGQMDMSHYPVLVELMKWREERARRGDLPRGWVADNETLVALSKVRPKSLEELRSFRGLSPKEVNRSGLQILEAVQRGRDTPRETIPSGARLPPMTDREDHILDLIQTYIAYLARQHEIAPRFLLSSNRAFALLQRAPKGAWIGFKRGLSRRELRT
jgi:ribonuclease D